MCEDEPLSKSSWVESWAVVKEVFHRYLNVQIGIYAFFIYFEVLQIEFMACGSR